MPIAFLRLIVGPLALCVACTSPARSTLDAALSPDGGSRDAGAPPGDAGAEDARFDDGGGRDAPAGDAGQAVDAGDGGTGGRFDAGPLSPCSAESPCGPDHTCTGMSCDGPWFCMRTFCDIVPSVTEYCGCDGVTFTDQPTCVRRPYAAVGRCAPMIEGACDPDLVVCDEEPPACDPVIPTAPSVDPATGCWTGDCIPVERCGCGTTDDCPPYTACNEAEGRCLPFRI